MFFLLFFFQALLWEIVQASFVEDLQNTREKFNVFRGFYVTRLQTLDTFLCSTCQEHLSGKI